jgi:hypothetical protein
MKKLLLSLLVFGFAAGTLVPVGSGADSSQAPRYKTNYKTIRMLGLDIYKSLKLKVREQINPEPVSIETDVTPFIKMVEYKEGGQPMRFTFVSAGFIDLVNNVAHAKAIDTVQKGYFEKYVLSLSQETGEKELRELPDLDNTKYWTDTVLNEQISNFNQMVGTAVAIKLAHFYQGHYAKYAVKLEGADGKYTPINNLLTPQEWDEAMKAGVRNALDAGLGIEGIKALYEAIEKMPKRPEWCAYFLPATAKYKTMKKEMEKIEKKFFAGEE